MMFLRSKDQTVAGLAVSRRERGRSGARRLPGHDVALVLSRSPVEADFPNSKPPGDRNLPVVPHAVDLEIVTGTALCCVWSKCPFTAKDAMLQIYHDALEIRY
jgi:hypothetical protein